MKSTFKLSSFKLSPFFIVPCLFIFILSGCTLWYSNDQVIDLKINVAHIVNESNNIYGAKGKRLARNVSHPIALRLFQLSDDNTFKKLDFMTLYKNDRKELVDSLIRTKHLGIFYPGEMQSIQLFLNADTKYIAVLAEFSDLSAANFKDIISVKQVLDNQLTIIVAQSNVFIQTPIIKD